ncbi:M24 family metallopeptidase [Hwanghaeella sp.]|uniref:M24 family metallopeptidase n=1 Tax=Hwanghaeella sp. TaxID=2605943 RepID=UPI003CCBFAD4
MALHFSEQELSDRRAKACAAMQEQDLDGLLITRQESMFYLTGYDTFGYVYFQCLYLGADGDYFLLTRAPDLRQARHTSTIEEVHVWKDVEGAEPHRELRDLLHQRGLAGKHLGVEYESYGLTAASGKKLDAALDGFVTLSDASMLVTRLRLIKSATELEYVRKAGELGDHALAEAHRLARPGADEGEILAAMQAAVFAGGGDYPGNEFIIGSGNDALLCRYKSGRRILDDVDQLNLEFAGAYRHYHAALFRTIPIGKAHPLHIEYHKAAHDALLACEEALTPGQTAGDVFDAHARILDAAGLADHRMNACGYSLGTTFSPNWMDWPMLYHGNPVEMRPGMVFFIHIIIFNSEAGIAQCLGRTSIVTETGAESLSTAGLDLFIGE